MTQRFTYLLTQHGTAATPTSVCLLLHHDSARRPRWPSTTSENLCRYLSCMQCTVQGKDFKLILTVKMETRHTAEGPFDREFPAIYNHCRVMMAWSRKTLKFCEQFLRTLFWKNDPSQTLATVWIMPKICCGQPPHSAHVVADFIQIGSLSAELLPNAWRPFLPHTAFILSL